MQGLQFLNSCVGTPLKLIISTVLAKHDRRGHIWPCHACTLKRCVFQYFSPGAISMKEDWVQGALFHSHTQTSYVGTRAFMRHRAYMPATIVIACGLLSPMPLFLAAFYCCGEKVKNKFNLLTFENKLARLAKHSPCTGTYVSPATGVT